MLLAVLPLVSCNSGYDEFLRMIPSDDSVPAPKPLVKVETPRSIAGGAVIKFVYPDDNNVRGAIATYVRGGKTVSTKASRYVDSLTVVGYADTEEHEVSISTFNVNEVQSEPVKVIVKPLPSAVSTVSCTISETYGGVKIYVEGNEAKADLAVVLLRDDDLSDISLPAEKRKWVEVTTLFTASNKVFLTRRNIEPVEALFGVYFRDHWGNTSPVFSTKLTPIEEVKLNKSLFKDANLPDDNCKGGNSTYALVYLWDDFFGATAEKHMFACDEAPRPCWLTINLGQTAHLSRIHTLPRIDYLIYSNAQVRDFEFWGWGQEANPTGKSVEPTEDNPFGFEKGWVRLGAFTQAKPSGYEEDGSVGDVTQEDRIAFNAGNDFDLDVGKWPHANDAVRYLRVVFVENFMTYKSGLTTMAVQISEITPYGLPL